MKCAEHIECMKTVGICGAGHNRRALLIVNYIRISKIQLREVNSNKQ
jgi:hypothetical protein